MFGPFAVRRSPFAVRRSTSLRDGGTQVGLDPSPFAGARAMKTRIQALSALEILDSRGHPTLRVYARLDDASLGSASVTAGASTGDLEAVELRDGDAARYGGKGVRQAIDNVQRRIAPALARRDAAEQPPIDRMLIELDGTPNKAALGANAVLGVSMPVARVAAASAGVPLYRWLGGAGAVRLPVPMINVLNGGKYADSALDFQEFMIMSQGAPSFAEALRWGDEGGFAPQLQIQQQAGEPIAEAIHTAGWRPGEDIAVALDLAASSFYEGGA